MCSLCPTGSLEPMTAGAGSGDRCSSVSNKSMMTKSSRPRWNGFVASVMERSSDENQDQAEESVLLQDAKREIAGKRLAGGRFYQFRMAFADTQAKGAFKIMEDDVSDALEADFVLPESAVKPGLKIPAVMYSIFGPGRRFRGDTVVGIREVSRQLEFESSYTLVEHAPEDSIQLEILPQAMKQVAKLSEAVGEGRYEDLLEILGHHPGKSLPDGVEPDNRRIPGR